MTYKNSKLSASPKADKYIRESGNKEAGNQISGKQGKTSIGCGSADAKATQDKGRQRVNE